MTNTARDRRVAEHYEHAVLDLVQAHAKLVGSPLALAVRFRLAEPLDVHLLEVVQNFPGEDDDLPFTTEFAPNERFVILGKLHLTLASPRQLERAIAKAKARKPSSESAEDARVRVAMKDLLKGGSVVYEARSPKGLATTARKAKVALGL